MAPKRRGSQAANSNPNKRLRKDDEPPSLNPEVTGSLYEPLPASITCDPSIRTDVLPVDPSQPFAPTFIKSLIPSTNANNVDYNYDTKVRNKVLLVDNPPADDKLKKERQAKRCELKRKRKLMSNKLRKKSGLYDIPTDVKYEAFLPLHQLWKGYMNMLLADSAHGTTAMMRLLKADYHGAVFSVVRSKCPTYVGITGIVIKETENMFYIVTEQDEAKVVPKRNNVFMFETREGERFTLFGNQFCTRSGERVAKKFKDKPTVDM